MAQRASAKSPAPEEPGAALAAVPVRRLTPRLLLRSIGPGVITGGADNDPAGVTTYTVVGASAGFSQNWLIAISTPLLIGVQTMSARVGNVLKLDLASAIRHRFGARVAHPVVLLVVVANVITIGADLLMMAAVTELMTGVSFRFFIVPYALLIAAVTIFVDYRRMARYLLWLAGVFATYIVAAFLSRPNWLTVLHDTLVPQVTLSPAYFIAAVGLLGTTITPYLFFWQTSGEVEGERGVQEMRRSRADITAGMVWSNISALFIMIVAAVVFFSHHLQITTPAQAAEALQPFAGGFAKYLFSIGVIGSGLLAIPVLAASTAYSVGGVLGWRRGLGRRVSNAAHFYLVLGLAILIGVQLAVINVNPVRALFYSQVLDGIIAPVLVALLVLITSNRGLMGDFANGRWLKTIGWVAVAVLSAADVALLYSVITQGLPG